MKAIKRHNPQYSDSRITLKPGSVRLRDSNLARPKAQCKPVHTSIQMLLELDEGWDCGADGGFPVWEMLCMFLQFARTPRARLQPTQKKMPHEPRVQAHWASEPHLMTSTDPSARSRGSAFPFKTVRPRSCISCRQPYSPIRASSNLLSRSARAFFRRGPHPDITACLFASLSAFRCESSTPDWLRSMVRKNGEQLNFRASLLHPQTSGSFLCSL